MKKIVIFILLILAFMGIVGGIGYTIYERAYPISVGLLSAGWMAWPKFRELFDKLIN